MKYLKFYTAEQNLMVFGLSSKHACFIFRTIPFKRFYFLRILRHTHSHNVQIPYE